MKISVVMSAYNAEKWIKKSLDSIMSQTYKDIEVIVVNDCSTDNTLSIAKSYDKVKVVNHEVNKGAGHSRKDGLAKATGDYVIFIDSDDWISSDFIEILVKRAEETNADIVSGGITVVREDGTQDATVFPIKVSEGFDKFKDYNKGRIIFLNNKIVKRSMYDKVEYSTKRFCEDTPVIVPLLYYANKVAYANTSGYYYLQHGASLCHSVPKSEQALLKGICAIDLINFFEDKEDDYKNLIPLNQVMQYIAEFKMGNPTEEVVERNQKDFNTLMLFLVNKLMGVQKVQQ